MSKEKSHQIAKALLAIGAVSLNPTAPFLWTSGLKAPIYCDNRLIISFPRVRSFIEEELAGLIEREFPAAEVIAGTATAGIPHAALVADRLDLPMIYVRASSKEHGKKNAIEGRVEPGQKVVMVEDLISTGQSVMQAAEKVKKAGGEVIGTVAIFNYGLQAGREAFKKEIYPLHTLTSYLDLVEFATQYEQFAPYKETLNAWYKDPVKWSKEAK